MLARGAISSNSHPRPPPLPEGLSSALALAANGGDEDGGGRAEDNECADAASASRLRHLLDNFLHCAGLFGLHHVSYLPVGFYLPSTLQVCTKTGVQ